MLNECKWIAAGAVMVFATSLTAQAPTAQPASATAPAATLNQLMRGLFFPHSNVVFATQRQDPAAIKHASEPSASSDPLTGVFGGWEAVENSALTLVDAADLLMRPGRKCSNGKDVPLDKPDWAQLVNAVREAGMVAYKAAQSKNLDKMLEVSDVLNTSCQNCHNKYRARNRCQ
jgi:hypothetical protein